MHTPKTNSKTVNSLNVTSSLSCPPPVQSGGGRRPGSLADAPQDYSTSEVFSPRTVLIENICRCVQHKLQHLPTTMPFLTTSTITLSCLTSAAPQADSCWLGHVEPDDVVIADIGGQALDILKTLLGSFSDTSSAGFNFVSGTFSYTSHTGFIFIGGVSLIHPVLASFSSGGFLLHIPCCLHFYLGSFS